MEKKRKQEKKILHVFVIVFNIVLILGLVAVFLTYDKDYKSKIYNQNLEDITNVNQASANIASTFFSGREAKLRDLALYIEENHMTLSEGMDYIYSSNSDETKLFELIGADYTGYGLVKDENGAYTPLDYSSGFGDICDLFDENLQQTDSQVISFAPEFTDSYSTMKSFGLYNCITFMDEHGKEIPYTLMVVAKSADFIDRINLDSGYQNLSTAIISEDGEYIINNGNFTGVNYFHYLKLFNDLTLDQQKKLENEMQKTGKGSLVYQNSRDERSLFVYTPVPEKNWFCVTAVPVDDFHNRGGEFSFSLIVVVIMLILLTMDLLYLAFLNRRLRLSAKNERIASAAKTDFLSRMSHDMRTPMNGIIGMTHLTQEIPGLSAEAQDNLAAIQDSSAYLLQLINDTLDMNKIESKKVTLNPETVYVKEFVDHIISTIRPLADQKKIQLEVVPTDVQWEYIRVDRMRVQQIFLNILSNAVKFTPEHGMIRTEIQCLNREKDISHMRISIEDNGCGMSEEFLEHIFESFSQEKTRIVSGQEGTGLGMAIVKNLVELMGGTVEIESRLGEGTKVTVNLDLERAPEVEKEKVVQPKKDMSLLKGKRVLLAEDHPLNATITIRLLEKKQMLVDHAEDGVQAVELFSRASQGYYDLILMDIRMPRMDGLEAARRIRALERPDTESIPILAMTANAYAEDVQAALDAKMNAHLSKPIEPDVLYQQLLNYLDYGKESKKL